MIRSLDVLIALFLLSVSLNVHSQSIGSSLIVHAGFQTGIAEFKPDDEYTVSTEDNQLYVAPYLAIGLKSGSGPWAFTFTVSSPNIVQEGLYSSYHSESTRLDILLWMVM